MATTTAAPTPRKKNHKTLALTTWFARMHKQYKLWALDVASRSTLTITFRINLYKYITKGRKRKNRKNYVSGTTSSKCGYVHKCLAVHRKDWKTHKLFCYYIYTFIVVQQTRTWRKTSAVHLRHSTITTTQFSRFARISMKQSQSKNQLLSLINYVNVK